MDSPHHLRIIPGPVYNDKTLSISCRFFFGEVYALIGDEGYCWAGNAYFAEVFDTSHDTISRWLRELKSAGHIYVDVIRDEKKQVSQRHIYPTIELPLPAKIIGGTSKNLRYSLRVRTLETSFPKVKEPKKAKRPHFLRLFPTDWSTHEAFSKVWLDFIEYRHQKKKQVTQISAKRLMTKLTQYDIPTAIKAINSSIENSWTGVFPESVKQDATKNSPAGLPLKKTATAAHTYMTKRLKTFLGQRLKADAIDQLKVLANDIDDFRKDLPKKIKRKDGPDSSNGPGYFFFSTLIIATSFMDYIEDNYQSWDKLQVSHLKRGGAIWNKWIAMKEDSMGVTMEGKAL